LKIGDSRQKEGPGILPLQDHGFKQDDRGLVQRASIIAGRIVGRTKASRYGRWLWKRGTVGDMTAGYLWRQSGKSTDRKNPAWRMSPFAARVQPPTTGSPGAPLGHAVTTLPIRDRTGLEDQNFDPMQSVSPRGGQTRLWPRFLSGWVGFMATGTREDDQEDIFLPTDPRLVAAHRGDKETGTIVVDATRGGAVDEAAQAPLQSVFRVVRKPVGIRGLAGNASNVVAIQLGRSGQGDTPGTLFADGPDQTGTYAQPAASGAAASLARPGVRDGGPFDCASGCTQHRIGADADGNPVNVLHFSDKTLFRTGNRAPITTGVGNYIYDPNGTNSKTLINYTTTPGGIFDGPQDFETRWPSPIDFEQYKLIVHMGWDPDKTYRLSRDAQDTQHRGMWRWWSNAPIGINTPGEPPKGPITPGGGKPPIGPPPGKIPGGDNNGGPITGGGGPVPEGGGPGTPPGDGAGGPGTGGPGFPPPVPPGGGRPTASGGPRGQDGDDPDPEPPAEPGTGIQSYPWGADWDIRLQDELRRRAKTRHLLDGLVQERSSAVLVPRTHAVMWMDFAHASQVARPQLMRRGEPDLRQAGTEELHPGSLGRAEGLAPHVMRTEAFGRQDAGGFAYTQAPGRSRSRSGTGNGGLVDLPPEHDMSDVALTSTYGDTTSMAGASESSRIIGYGVTLAWGKPSVTTGKPMESVGATADYTNKSLKFRYFAADGTPSDIVEIALGLITVADQVNVVTGIATGTTIATTAAQKVGFHGSASAQNTGWGSSGVSGVKALTAASTLADVLDYLGELEGALKDKGIVAA
jgi:hypothetical protein